MYELGLSFLKDITDYKILSHHCFNFKRAFVGVNSNFYITNVSSKLLKFDCKYSCIIIRRITFDV